MIATLVLRLLGAAAPKWLSKPIAYLIDAALIAALLVGTYFWIHDDGEKVGGQKVTAKVEQQHAKTVTEARADERVAQAVTDHIAVNTARKDGAAEAALRAQIEELHNELDQTTAAASGAPAVADTGRLSASLNSLVDRANRAGQDPGGEPGAVQDGAVAAH